MVAIIYDFCVCCPGGWSVGLTYYFPSLLLLAQLFASCPSSAVDDRLRASWA
jgi:hypothetical protein